MKMNLTGEDLLFLDAADLKKRENEKYGDGYEAGYQSGYNDACRDTLDNINDIIGGITNQHFTKVEIKAIRDKLRVNKELYRDA